MTVTSGRKCSELLESCSPVGSLVRMLLESSIWRSTLCSLTWKTKATKAGRCLFRLAASTRRTGASAAQFWPTVTGFDAAGGELKGKEYCGTRHAMKLGQAVRMFPTPRASDAKLTGPIGSPSAEYDLKHHQLRGFILYPTPTTGAGLCGGTGNYQQMQALEAAGQITPEERRSMQAGNGGQLNPDWVEWLMGYPIGWSEV